MTPRWSKLLILFVITVGWATADDSASCSCVAKSQCSKTSVQNNLRKTKLHSTVTCTGDDVYCCGDSVKDNQASTPVQEENLNESTKESENGTEPDNDSQNEAKKAKKKLNVVTITGMRKKPKFQPRVTPRKSSNISLPVIKPIGLRSRPRTYGKNKKPKASDKTDQMNDNNQSQNGEPKTQSNTDKRLPLNKSSKMMNRPSPVSRVPLRKFPPRLKMGMTAEPSSDLPKQSTGNEETMEEVTTPKTDETNDKMSSTEDTKSESTTKPPVKDVLQLPRIKHSRRNGSVETNKEENVETTMESLQPDTDSSKKSDDVSPVPQNNDDSTDNA